MFAHSYHIAQINKLAINRFQQPMKDFAAALAVDPNAAFWHDYMTMVRILLCFTRAQRDGLWDLHRYAFIHMLQFCLSCRRGTKQHGVFQDHGDTLKNITKKDVAIPEIQECLLSAEHLG